MIAFVVCGATCADALRMNYLEMTHLRDQVYAADKNNNNVAQALQNLRAYVNSHMNTSLSTDNGVYPPIQLKYTYQRLQQAENDRVQKINSTIYTQAQQTCEQELTAGHFQERIGCIEQYVKDHNAATVREIPAAMYKFDFASPSWSPDLAGISMVLSIAFAILAALRFGGGWALRRLT